jgi:hypothetical protein
VEDLYLAYNMDQEKLGCASFTLVIKNDSLNQKYPGGLRAFIEKYHATCNRHISVTCDMGSEVGEKLDDIAGNGLLPDQDFWTYDFWSHALAMANGPGQKLEPHAIDTGIEWLRSEYAGRTDSRSGFRVWYVPERPKRINPLDKIYHWDDSANEGLYKRLKRKKWQWEFLASGEAAQSAMHQWVVSFNIGHTKDNRFWALQTHWYRRIVVIGELQNTKKVKVSEIAQQLLREYDSFGGHYIDIYHEKGNIRLPKYPRDIYR